MSPPRPRAGSTAGVVPAMVLYAAHNMPGFVAPAEGASSPILDYSLPIIAAVWLLLGAALAAYSGAGRLGEQTEVVANSADYPSRASASAARPTTERSEAK